MCGLFGFSGARDADPFKIKLGLVDNMSRGSHATGIWGSKTDTLIKKADNASEFIRDREVSKVATSPLVIGHTRRKTTGANTDENAHPYRFHDADLIGSHNGWLIDVTLDKLAKEHGIPVPDVDSKMIYEILIKESFDYDVLSAIPGTMALAFAKDGFLFLYRRPSKPLYIGQSDEGIYYSSLISSLQQVDASGIMKLSANRMYVFKDGLLVDKFSIAESYLNSLPEDSSRSNWRRDCTDDELKELCDDFGLTQYGYKQQVPYGHYSDYREQMPRANQDNENAVELNNDQVMDMVLGADKDRQNSAVRLKVLADFGDSFSDETRYEPVSDAQVSISDIWEFTGSNGMTTIIIPDKTNDCSKKMIKIWVPEENKEFYTKSIKINKSTILEVVVYLPFFREEKKEIQSSVQYKKKGSSVSIEHDYEEESIDVLPWNDEVHDENEANMVVNKGEEVPLLLDDPIVTYENFMNMVSDGKDCILMLRDAMDVGADEASKSCAMSDAMSLIDSWMRHFEDYIDYIDDQRKLNNF